MDVTDAALMSSRGRVVSFPTKDNQIWIWSFKYATYVKYKAHSAGETFLAKNVPVQLRAQVRECSKAIAHIDSDKEENNTRA